MFNDQFKLQLAVFVFIRRRNDVIDKKRNLKDIFEGNEQTECMDVEENKTRKRYVKLMLSEWLTEVPDDLESNWLIKLSPEGQRRLVVACKVLIKHDT